MIKRRHCAAWGCLLAPGPQRPMCQRHWYMVPTRWRREEGLTPRMLIKAIVSVDLRQRRQRRLLSRWVAPPPTFRAQNCR